MTSSPIRSRARGLAAVCVLAASFGASCYNPSIKDGGYLCNTELSPSCPSGFHCDASNKYCLRDGSNKIIDAGSDVSTVDTHPSVDASVDKTVAEAGHDAPVDVACFSPVATCTAAAGLTCDPYCQTGCGCHDKCAVVNGALACSTPFGTLGNTGDACTIASNGADNCRPGLTCVTDGCGNRCYKYCRSDQDCPMSACNRDAGAGQKVCDVPHVTCNPIKTTPSTWGCPLTNDGCYLSPTVVDVTLCDCPNVTSPTGGGIGAPCKVSHDCYAGLVCIDPTGGNNFQCHEVCMLGAATTCIGGGSCTALNRSAKYGFCN
ncbi:MAG TPA: hypothetical protein VH560_07400 [Polyangia bacterium]|nr:hypothetical protein [Polyangia bacterium]